MRNQTWSQNGNLISDLEIYREAEKVLTKDWLKNEIREANPEEVLMVEDEEKLKRWEELKDKLRKKTVTLKEIQELLFSLLE